MHKKSDNSSEKKVFTCKYLKNIVYIILKKNLNLSEKNPFLSTIIGLHGPEGNMPKDGQYDWELILSSSKLHGVAPTAMNDGRLCVKDEI